MGTEVLRRRAAVPLHPVLQQEAVLASALPHAKPSDLILVTVSLTCSWSSHGQPQDEPGLGHPGLCWVDMRRGRASLFTSGVRCDVPPRAGTCLTLLSEHLGTPELLSELWSSSGVRWNKSVPFCHFPLGLGDAGGVQ